MTEASLDPKITETLTIDWSFPEPPLAAKDWFSWTAELWDEVQKSSKDPLESLMIKAFEHRLPRTTGWDVQKVPAAGQEMLASAASLFRRGVAYRKTADTPHPVPRQGQYPVRIYRGETLPMCFPREAFFIIDHNVEPTLAWNLDKSEVFVANISEKTKDWNSLQLIRDAWCRAGKPTPWVIMGGGVVADVAACAAALEGVPFILVPTTLLAMVDACVGGKTGINFPPFGKNQLGRFAFPESCVMWPGWLKTLPEREFRAGLAECVKHALLAPDGLVMPQLESHSVDADLLRRLIEVKAKTVMADPAEQSIRASLNLGHTLAHALEAKSHALHATVDGIILHGEAVGYGLVFALYVSHRMAGLDETSLVEGLKRVRESGCLGSLAHLEETVFGRNVGPSGAFNEMLPYMFLDKKSSSLEQTHLSMTLLSYIGGPSPGPDGRYNFKVPLDVAHQAFHEFWQFLS